MSFTGAGFLSILYWYRYIYNRKPVRLRSALGFCVDGVHAGPCPRADLLECPRGDKLVRHEIAAYAHRHGACRKIFTRRFGADSAGRNQFEEGLGREHILDVLRAAQAIMRLDFLPIKWYG